MKKLFVLIILFLLTGCMKKTSYIDTIVIEGGDKYITINYPVTNTSLDLNIKRDIDKIYNEFIDIENIELNIDYLFYELDKDISVTLFIYINHNNEVKKYVKTYYYNNKLLTIDDFVDRKLINKLLLREIKSRNLPTNIIYKDLEFSFDNNNLTVYFNRNIDYIDIKIPLTYLNKQTIKEDTKMTNADPPESIVDPNKKVVALTFDDGPSIYTEEIIEYLYKNNCPSTFFVLGNKVNNYSHVIKKSISYGMEIGNHSYNHKWLIKLKKNEVIEQIEKTQTLIKEATGYTPKVLRPTYGDINNTIRNNTDLDIVLWNIDTLDWKYKSVDRISRRATSKLKDGNIILMHDIYRRTASALKKIVPILKEEGYQCVTISELNEINKLRNLYE